MSSEASVATCSTSQFKDWHGSIVDNLLVVAQCLLPRILSRNELSFSETLHRNPVVLGLHGRIQHIHRWVDCQPKLTRGARRINYRGPHRRDLGRHKGKLFHEGVHSILPFESIAIKRDRLDKRTSLLASMENRSSILCSRFLSAVISSSIARASSLRGISKRRKKL